MSVASRFSGRAGLVAGLLGGWMLWVSASAFLLVRAGSGRPAVESRLEAARLLSAWMGEAWGFRDRYQLQQALRAAAKHPGLIRGAVADANGRVLVHTDLSQLESPFVEPKGRLLAARDGCLARETGEPGGRASVSFSAPLPGARGAPPGATLHLVYAAEGITGGALRTAAWIWVSALLGALACFALGWRATAGRRLFTQIPDGRAAP